MDRNKVTKTEFFGIGQSLSARRAWIEISQTNNFKLCNLVALRKESVDRNKILVKSRSNNSHVALRKESVDRNICITLKCLPVSVVALRKESVDRNYIIKITGKPPRGGRSPQGERG